MINRENVVKALEDSYRYSNVEEGCTLVLQDVVLSAISLLKEQEPIRPTWLQGKAYCGSCGHGFPRKSADREINYCSYCGRTVKWNDLQKASHV